MKALYIETSAILSWLFGESESETVIQALNEHDAILSSVLSILETRRSLIRAENQGIISAADRLKLEGFFASASAGWNFMEIDLDVRERAARIFPVEPVRSLDAIHLATALEFLKAYPDLIVLSMDEGILNNLIPLGLPAL